MFLFIWYNTNQSPILKTWKLKCEVVFFCTTCNFLHIPRYVWCACCCWCTEPSGTWREGPWIKMLWCCDIDSSIIIIYSICQLNWLTWHSLRSDLIWAEESWTSLVRSLNTPTSMRTQCQAQSSMNSWDMLLLQSTTRQRSEITLPSHWQCCCPGCKWHSSVPGCLPAPTSSSCRPPL